MRAVHGSLAAPMREMEETHRRVRLKMDQAALR